VIVPVETPLTEPYWTAARRGTVLLQHCGACELVWHPPAPVCPGCRGTSWQWRPASGRGVVHSATRVVHPAHRQVDDVVPYVLVLVELAEGPLFLCGLLGDGGVGGTGGIDVAELDRRPVTIELGTAAGGERLPMARPD
jgi:uncharacterized OB-fold protein